MLVDEFGKALATGKVFEEYLKEKGVDPESDDVKLQHFVEYMKEYNLSALCIIMDKNNEPVFNGAQVLSLKCPGITPSQIVNALSIVAHVIHNSHAGAQPGDTVN